MTQSRLDPEGGASRDLVELQRALQRMKRLLGSRRIFTRLMAAAGADLTQQSWDVLETLQDGAARAVSEIAQAAHLDTAVVSRQLKALERDGWATRDGKSGGSVVLVTATDRGRALVSRVWRIRALQLDGALVGWTAEDRRLLTSLLHRLADALPLSAYRPSGGPLDDHAAV